MADAVKDPMQKPSVWKEPGGKCPRCGAETIARKSRKTGELYFGCTAGRKGCKFKGCRSH